MPQQTVVRGIVRMVGYRGVRHDEGHGHMDSNPDRSDFNIDVIDGPSELFSSGSMKLVEAILLHMTMDRASQKSRRLNGRLKMVH